MESLTKLKPVLLKDDPKDTVRIEADKERCAAAAEILGVNEQWTDCFIEGFDGRMRDEVDDATADDYVSFGGKA